MPDMNRVKALVMNSKAVQDATHSKKLKAEAAAMLVRQVFEEYTMFLEHSIYVYSIHI